MPARARHSLKRKLLRTVVGVLVCVAGSTLAVVAWLHAEAEQRHLQEIEAAVRDSIAGKARMLVNNHAQALRGLVADNAFTDVFTLVEREVRGDKDILYGVFIAADGKPWAYASPSTKSFDGDLAAALGRVQELPLPADAWHSTRTTQRRLRIFEQDVLETAGPVIDDGQLLGTIRYGLSAKPLHEALARVRRESRLALQSTLSWIGGSILVCTLLGVLMVRRASAKIVSPLETLTDAAERIAAGQPGVRVSVETGDELELLGQAFNHMQQANEEAILRASQAMEAALESSRMKSEFLANMSHEIRTPMNGVLGMIRMILKQLLDAKLRRYAETVEKSAGALMTIVDDILDFSKMEAGKYTLQSMPFDPGEVLQEAAELLANRAFDKRLELIYRRAPNIPRQIVGDPDRYRQILNNLVGNAIKFSDEGEVFIDLSLDACDGDSYVLRTKVHDSGIGISVEDQAKLFNAFSQVDGSMVRRYGGTGLGLAISKRLTELMDGHIGVVSERGVGSTFWFTMRVTKAPDEVAAAPLPWEAGQRALLVEDNRRWARIIEEQLVAWGLRCGVHSTGRSALTQLQTQEFFHVAVVSAQLHDMALPAYIRELRAIASAKDLPLIVLTPLGTSAVLNDIEHEVLAQVTKPLRLSELHESIAAALVRSSLRVPPRAQAASVRNSGKRVLVVDDNEVNQLVAVEHAEEAGFEVDVASDGEQAVAKVKAGQYAVILMDCQMPVMDGYAATHAIRAWERDTGSQARTPIIALTAHAMAGEREKVMAAGMDDYLTKPLRPHALEHMLARYANANDNAIADTPPALRRVN